MGQAEPKHKPFWLHCLSGKSYRQIQMQQRRVREINRTL